MLELAFRVPYPIRDLADTTNGPLRLSICGFLSLLLRLSLLAFVSPFLRNGFNHFLLVSEDSQTELATKVHVGVVLCWNRDHVPRLNNLPANRTVQCKKKPDKIRVWAELFDIYSKTGYFHYMSQRKNAIKFITQKKLKKSV